MDRAAITTRLKQEARRLGFDLAGACPAVAPSGLHNLHQWLAAGYAGEMRYLADRVTAYEHPGHVLAGVRSLLVVAVNYRTVNPTPVAPGQGRISRYAWGLDYHDLIHARLDALAELLRQLVPGRACAGWSTRRLSWTRVRAVGRPGLDRKKHAPFESAQRQLVLLGRATDRFRVRVRRAAGDRSLRKLHRLPRRLPNAGLRRSLCARQSPLHQLSDDRASIEHSDRIARSPGRLGLRLRCLPGCLPLEPPRTTSPLDELHPAAGADPLELVSLFSLSEDDFRIRFRHTPLWRAKRRGLLRNAAIALGNCRAVEAVPALVLGLEDHEPLVRGACAWALGQLGDSRTADALAHRMAAEADDEVRGEIAAALQAASRTRRRPPARAPRPAGSSLELPRRKTARAPLAIRPAG